MFRLRTFVVARYFFDVIADGNIHPDDLGELLSDTDDLAHTAKRKAGDLIQAVTQERSTEWWAMEVRNEARQIVGRVSLVVSGFDASQPSR